jgi:hypothetical protein
MALAPYFNKAALAASHVLQGFDSDAFASFLEAKLVSVVFDANASLTNEGRTTLDLLINLLARLYPRISLVAVDGVSIAIRKQIASVAYEVNPAIEVGESADTADYCVVIGRSRCPENIPHLYIGSDSWVVGVSPDQPVESSNSQNPFGAAAAACFGAAAVFRALFADQLPKSAPDISWRMSLLDMDTTRTEYNNPPLPSDVSIGEVHLVGVGAIGNGVIWALSRIHGLNGIFHLIDAETVDASNPQRYVLASPSDIDSPKVELAAHSLSKTALEVFPHQLEWASYLAKRGDWCLERVLVALDSARDRRAVQSSLPRWIANSWTQTGDLGVSRHPRFGTDSACLFCLYFPDGAMPNEEDLVAAAIGMPKPEESLKMEIRRLLHSGDPIGTNWVGHIAAKLSVTPEALAAFADKPLRAFYREAICGGLVLSLGGGAEGSEHAEVPMAFQSVLAGVLLAAELVGTAAGLVSDNQDTTVTRVNLLGPLGTYLTRPLKPHPSGRCICCDPAFRMAYIQKYAESSYKNEANSHETNELFSEGGKERVEQHVL